MLMAIEARGWVLDPLVADLRGQQDFAGRGQLVMKVWESVTGAFCCLCRDPVRFCKPSFGENGEKKRTEHGFLERKK